MAGSVNKAIIIGNLGANPELKYTPGGTAVCELRIATNDVWNDKQGQRQERTEWHRVIVFGKTAENCNQYLAKGRQVYIEGRIQTRSWDDKDGNKKYMTEIVAQDVRFLGGGSGEGRAPSPGMGGSAPAPSRGGPPAQEGPPPDFGGGGDDDIPF